MKIALCITIIICFSYMGYCYSKNYFDRCAYFFDLKNFTDYVIMCVNYNTENIFNIVSSYNFKSTDLKKDMENFCKNIYEFDIKKLSCCNYMTEKDIKIINGFFDNLGKQDKQSTINFLEKMRAEISCYHTALKNEEKNKGVLPLKLFVSLGLAICIILI